VTRALVTGCSSGIGLAITEAQLAQGWQVTGISRHAPALEDPGFTHLAADLADPAAADRAFANIGPVEAAVHAAGLARLGPHDSMDLAEGALMWRLHVDTAARMIQHLAPQMPDGGRIVLIGSRVAAGVAGRSLYAASKAALIGLSRSIAAELASRRITVNVVAPAATDTPMLRDPARAATPPKLPPMGRLVQPEEVAALVAFLLSPPAASITGQHIVICAGSSL
jgi:NAD(P)-dependent dehydrogenase (short-subunit alcohol dehydrogenase family)